jgi:hypothetical protein
MQLFCPNPHCDVDVNSPVRLRTVDFRLFAQFVQGLKLVLYQFKLGRVAPTWSGEKSRPCKSPRRDAPQEPSDRHRCIRRRYTRVDDPWETQREMPRDPPAGHTRTTRIFLLTLLRELPSPSPLPQSILMDTAEDANRCCRFPRLKRTFLCGRLSGIFAPFFRIAGKPSTTSLPISRQD